MNAIIDGINLINLNDTDALAAIIEAITPTTADPVAAALIIFATKPADAHPAQPWTGGQPARTPKPLPQFLRRIRATLHRVTHPYRNPYSFKPYPPETPQHGLYAQRRRPSNPIATRHTCRII